MSAVQWPTSASLTSHQSNVGNELLPGNNFHSLIVFKLKPLPNSKFYHKHFMLKHNKLKHLFYTNICGVLKLFFVLHSNKFFCFFWNEQLTVEYFYDSENYFVVYHVFVKCFYILVNVRLMAALDACNTTHVCVSFCCC